jgi:hypothetical protein
MFVILTYEASVCCIHGPFKTQVEAHTWALSWYGDEHYSVERLNEPPIIATNQMRHEEQDCC